MAHVGRGALVGLALFCSSARLVGVEGLVSKPEPLIRDASWITHLDYDCGAFYVLAPQLYNDKVTVCEIKPSYKNSILNLFCVVVDRHWNFDISKSIKYDMDALDALSIAAQAASPEIAQEALRILPLSKAISESGRTIDYKNKELVINNKINIDQVIWQAYDWMSFRINTLRTTKLIPIPVAALGYFIVSKDHKSMMSAKKLFDDLLSTCVGCVGLNPDGDYGQFVKNLVKCAPYALLGCSVFLIHRLQHMYTDGYVKVFELLLTSNKVMFDAAKTKAYLLELSAKVNTFGFGKSYSQRLLKLAARL